MSTPRLGFTLLELIVVLAIMGILAVVSVPALTNRHDDDPLTAGARAIVQLLARTRATAVARGHVVAITFDAASARYWVSDEASDARGVIRIDSLALPPGVAIVAETSRPRLVFAPSGETSGASLAVRWGPSTRAIRVDRWTGEATADAR